MLKVFMKHGICLSGFLGIHLNLRMLVMLLDVHYLILVNSMLDVIMLLFGVIFVILLSIKLICVLTMHAMLSLTLHHLGIIPMLSRPYMIHPFL